LLCFLFKKENCQEKKIVKKIKNHKFYRSDFKSPDNNLWDMMQVYMDKSKLFKFYNLTIEDVIQTWTKSSNYPIVEVIRLNNHTIKIKQYHHHLNGDTVLQNAHNGCIPITFTTYAKSNFFDTKPYEWLIPKSQDTVTVLLNEDDWIIVNLQQTGK
jgi:hypothetical protein